MDDKEPLSALSGEDTLYQTAKPGSLSEIVQKCRPTGDYYNMQESTIEELFGVYVYNKQESNIEELFGVYVYNMQESNIEELFSVYEKKETEKEQIFSPFSYKWLTMNTMSEKKETEIVHILYNRITKSLDLLLKPENLYADTNPRMKMKSNKMELHTDFLSRMMLGDRMPSNISVANNDDQLPELQDQAPPANVRSFLNKKNITETSKHKINLDIDKELPTHRFVTPFRSQRNELRSFVPVSA
ncbi:uncharacterized protein LOC106066898 isoform X2 [Biomphalaria glabrata]|uniref:Uncharacterized protein LOC106066898 isoform X2 n=1 Tax=Biomphalaria glabrata TaxID=6526 RepID=A0A9W3AXX2_BIOGL|nr:uncharacterized protein LOC106066898 isoform X2 [Biomphalaria glabrata]